MDNETKPLQDWRANSNQPNRNDGYNQYAQSNQTQFMQPQQQPNYGQPQYGQPNYGNQAPAPGVPAEVENMKIVKLVFAFILFWPLGIPALIFFIKAKNTASTDPTQAVYFAERFNHFSRLAIMIGIIAYAAAFLFGIIGALANS
ncbi:MAG: DUF2852 domain-containing protein [Muribaculaceae bacterium]|nr:DUF2852 domain-containing protein [Muribaculaceae bacterium]